jgi:uncharacterized protein YkwD
MHRLINTRRVQVGVSHLRVTKFLRTYAEMRSRVMRRNHSLAPHDPCIGCGEVLGRTPLGPVSIFLAWMRSPVHRRILLTPGLHKLGCGMVAAKVWRYWTCEVRY